MTIGILCYKISDKGGHMSKYSNAKNFFEINMIKDFNSKKMMTITDNEINFLQRMILNPIANSSISTHYI